MRRLVATLLAIGADARDDEDLRLRKLLLLTAALTIIPLAVLWGGIYWAFDQRLAAAIPWSYAGLSALAIAIFARTRRYLWLAVSQFGVYTALPFALMWVLGGFVHGSAVALWALLAPIIALVLGHRRLAAGLFIAFAVGLALSALGQAAARPSNNLPPAAVLTFFVLNLLGVGLVAYVVIAAFAGGRQSALGVMRGIIRRYFSPDVADTILADPERQELGGELVEVSILFADLGGYTSYSEATTPDEVVALLNRYFAAAVPCILAEGGTPLQLPGDAVMAVFGAPRRQPDHAVHAARAALGIQAATLEVAREHPDWPRFRIGLNSGPALVGNIGSEEFRNFTAIGDTPNLASRLEGIAEPGQVVIGPRTAELLGGKATLEALAPARVKGKSEPVLPFALEGIATS